MLKRKVASVITVLVMALSMVSVGAVPTLADQTDGPTGAPVENQGTVVWMEKQDDMTMMPGFGQGVRQFYDYDLKLEDEEEVRHEQYQVTNVTVDEDEDGILTIEKKFEDDDETSNDFWWVVSVNDEKFGTATVKVSYADLNGEDGFYTFHVTSVRELVSAMIYSTDQEDTTLAGNSRSLGAHVYHYAYSEGSVVEVPLDGLKYSWTVVSGASLTTLDADEDDPEKAVIVEMAEYDPEELVPFSASVPTRKPAEGEESLKGTIKVRLSLYDGENEQEEPKLVGSEDFEFDVADKFTVMVPSSLNMDLGLEESETVIPEVREYDSSLEGDQDYTVKDNVVFAWECNAPEDVRVTDNEDGSFTLTRTGVNNTDVALKAYMSNDDVEPFMVNHMHYPYKYYAFSFVDVQNDHASAYDGTPLTLTPDLSPLGDVEATVTFHAGIRNIDPETGDLIWDPEITEEDHVFTVSGNTMTIDPAALNAFLEEKGLGDIDVSAMITYDDRITWEASCVVDYREPCPEDSHVWYSRVLKPATEEEEGLMGYICTRCGMTKTEVIEKIEPSPEARDISNARVTGIENSVYKARPIVHAISVKLAGKQLVEDTDYTVTYKDNVNVGTATVTLTGIGEYTGTDVYTFKIRKAGQFVDLDLDEMVQKFNKGYVGRHGVDLVVNVITEEQIINQEEQKAEEEVKPSEEVTPSEEGQPSEEPKPSEEVTPSEEPQPAPAAEMNETVNEGAQSAEIPDANGSEGNIGAPNTEGSTPSVTGETPNTEGEPKVEGEPSEGTIGPDDTTVVPGTEGTTTPDVPGGQEGTTTPDVPGGQEGETPVIPSEGEDEPYVPVVKFASTNDEVVTVDEKGHVDFTGVGMAMIYIKAEADENHRESAWKIIPVTVTKAANTMQVFDGATTVSAKKVAKKNVKIRRSDVFDVENACGIVRYAKADGNEKITVNKYNGAITIKKGLKKGSYTINVKVHATGDNNHKPRSRYSVVNVVVK